MHKPLVARTLLLLSLSLLLGACRSQPERTGPDPDDDHFGDAVRNMVRQQIYDPQAAAHPAQDPPLSSDGARAEAALSSYRQGPSSKAQPLGEAAAIGVSSQH